MTDGHQLQQFVVVFYYLFHPWLLMIYGYTMLHIRRLNLIWTYAMILLVK